MNRSVLILTTIYLQIFQMNNRFLAPLYNLVWLPKGPYTLAIIGSVFPIGPVPPFSEIQSRWATRVFAGRCRLPSAEIMCKDVARVQNECSTKGDRQYRVPYVGYIDSVAEQIGCKPNLWKYKLLKLGMLIATTVLSHQNLLM